MKKNLVFFMGSGNTGKTSVLKVLEKTLDLKHDVLLSSITRQFYKKNNVENEIEFNKLKDMEKFEFQFKLLNFYIEQFNNSIKENKNYYVDRCIIDHCAYTIFQGKNVLSKNDFDNIKLICFNFFKSLQDSFNITICYFPFPAPWSLENGSSDGFRDDNFSKNYILDSLMYKISTNLVYNLDLHLDLIEIPLRDIKNDLLTPEKRLEYLNDIMEDISSDREIGEKNGNLLICLNTKQDTNTFH